MGFEDSKFVSQVEDNYHCTLCRGVLDNPLFTPCKRLFCAACILPRIMKDPSCPAPGCKEKVQASDLKNALELRHTILNKEVRCDFYTRGCHSSVTLADLQKHMTVCRYRPIQCVNRGCPRVMNHKDLAMHERDACEFRPAGICQKGCKLVVLHRDVNTHHCVEALRSLITSQEVKISTLEADLRQLCHRHESREKMLVAKMSNLHNEIQQQAIGFQKKLKDYINRIAYLNKKINEGETGYEETTLTFTLERQEGSLGFNIMGGYSQDNSLSDGVVVSRVTEDSPADLKGMTVHDQILKINGQDLTQSSHEEAVEAFQSAQEPIVVEVLRRVAKGSHGNKMKTRSPTMVSIATQTDEIIEEAYLNLFRPPTPPFGMCGFENLSLVQPTSRHGVAFSPAADIGLTDLDVANGLEFEEEFDGERAYDMEYEEVTLHRRSSKEKIGLTLCYSNNEDGITDVFISEVEPYSIAAQDGGIRERDQILQINNVDVHSREQAIQLFSENRSDITLLLARPQVVPMDDGFMDERNALDDLYSLEVLEQQGRQDLDFTAAVFAHGNEEEGGTTDTATTENSAKHEKDSGVGRTDESTKNDESSEQELMENDCASPASNTKYNGGLGGSSAELHYSNDSFTSNDHEHEIPAEACDKFREVLETRCHKGGATSSTPEASPRKHASSRNNNVLPRNGSQSSIEREIAALNHEMEQIQMECQEIVEAHAREQHKITKQGAERSGAKGASPVTAASANNEVFRSPRMVPRMGTRLDYLKQLHAAHESMTQQSASAWGRHEQFTNPAMFQALMANEPSSSGVSTMDSNVRKSKDQSKDKDLSTTSAYNSAESCRSTPLTLELHQASDDSSKSHNASMLCLAAPTASPAPAKPSHSDSERLQAGGSQTKARESSSDGDGKLSQSQSSNSVSRMSQTQEPDNAGSLQQLYAQYADVMYTNKANLQHTIMVQQKLFQQQLMQRASKLNNNTSEAVSNGTSATTASTPIAGKCTQEAPGASPTHSASSLAQNHIYQELQSPGRADGGASSCNASGSQMEWVVKRRADGSRYITRRPVRSKLLKERARKVAEERCGMTTDDDAVSELKVGRYWSKEERKRHLEKSKDRRKKEVLQRTKMETVKEGEETQSSPKKEPNIVQLSHRKMMKHKGKKVFDDFTTLQEMLAHGNRDPQGKTYNPLLSVTTV